MAAMGQSVQWGTAVFGKNWVDQHCGSSECAAMYKTHVVKRSYQFAPLKCVPLP